MPGHQFDGKSYATLEAVLTIIDRWLDHGDVPDPYVWPVSPKRS
jgi:hypothetical protein